MAIHKDRSPTFYCDTAFLNLASLESAPLGREIDEHVSMSDALAAAQGAQKFRNMYLSISANGERQDPPKTEDSPFPKELLRAAAQLSHALSPGMVKESKFDTNNGLVYLVGLIAKSHANLHEDLAKRMGGRGAESVQDGEWDALLEYWEALASVSANLLMEPTHELKDEFMERAILSNSHFRIDPWSDASSNDELVFKRKLKELLPISNRLFDSGDYNGVVKCWSALLENPRFDPGHEDWLGRPFFILAIQGSLIDLSYAHMQLLSASTNAGPENHLTVIFRAASLILSVPPYALSGPSASTLNKGDAIYGNKCYLTYLENLERFLKGWPQSVVKAFCKDVSWDDNVEARAITRKYEVEFIMRREK